MNHQEKYRAWKARSRPVNVSADFATAVMRRVRQQAEQRRQVQWNWPKLLEFFQRNRLAQFAAVAVAVLIGLSRWWLMYSVILEP